MIEMESEKARYGDEKRIISMKDVIVLDEGTRSWRGRRTRCSRGKSSARCGPKSAVGDILKKQNQLETTETGFLSSFFEC